MRVARRAGHQAASSAAVIKTAVLASKVGGSLAPTSYKLLWSSLPMPIPPAAPNTTPISSQ